jgi:hypothetical protein
MTSFVVNGGAFPRASISTAGPRSTRSMAMMSRLLPEPFAGLRTPLLCEPWWLCRRRVSRETQEYLCRGRQPAQGKSPCPQECRIGASPTATICMRPNKRSRSANAVHGTVFTCISCRTKCVRKDLELHLRLYTDPREDFPGDGSHFQRKNSTFAKVPAVSLIKIMSGLPDDGVINRSDPNAMLAWARILGVHHAQILIAVAVVGSRSCRGARLSAKQ